MVIVSERCYWLHRPFVDTVQHQDILHQYICNREHMYIVIPLTTQNITRRTKGPSPSHPPLTKHVLAFFSVSKFLCLFKVFCRNNYCGHIPEPIKDMIRQKNREDGPNKPDTKTTRGYPTLSTGKSKML